MGILDNLSNTFSKGTAVVERNSKVLMMRTKIAEIRARRTNACSALGAELYGLTRFDPAFRTGREALFDNIASCDVEIKELEDKIAALETEVSAQKAAVAYPVCPACGATIDAGSAFCRICGARIIPDTCASVSQPTSYTSSVVPATVPTAASVWQQPSSQENPVVYTKAPSPIAVCTNDEEQVSTQVPVAKKSVSAQTAAPVAAAVKKEPKQEYEA